MRRILILLTTCLMLLVGVSAPAGAHSEVTRPFAGTASGPVLFLPEGLPCPAPPFLTTTVPSIPGTALHLGRITLFSQHCAALGPFGPGTMTLVAANGDKLVFRYTGEGPLIPTPAFRVTSEATVIDGTGRFEDASGHMSMTGDLRLPQFPSFDGALITFHWTGHISY
ncbi:MAG TPA: hypothetical protein VF143_07340 [Candidatus Nanopelagicales bacterium]